MPFDPDIVLRIDGNSDTFEVEVDKKPYITLNFKNSTFEPESVGVSLEDPALVISGLTIGSLTLSPSFDSETMSYTAETSNNTNKITATCDDGEAEISISLSNSSGVSAINNGAAATWADGENTLTVTAEKAGAKSVYSVIITKL